MWLLVQLAALAMAVYRVPLAAQYPQPAEFQAVRLMLATQFSALALLFPWMLRTWGSGLAVSAAAWAMLFAATALSAGTFAATVPVGTFLTAWIVIFLTLAQVRGAGLQAIIMSVAATYVLGGPLMWYLQREFTTAATGSSAWVFGPLLAAISTTPHLPPSAWVQAAAAELATILLWKLASRPQNAPSRPSNFEAPRIIP